MITADPNGLVICIREQMSGTVMLSPGDEHVTVGSLVALYPASHRTSHEELIPRVWVQFPMAMCAPSVMLHGLAVQVPVDWIPVVFAVLHVTTWEPESP